MVLGVNFAGQIPIVSICPVNVDPDQNSSKTDTSYCTAPLISFQNKRRFPGNASAPPGSKVELNAFSSFFNCIDPRSQNFKAVARKNIRSGHDMDKDFAMHSDNSGGRSN